MWAAQKMQRWQDKIFQLELGVWIGIWEDAMCPRNSTREFWLCLLGIGQADNKEDFNFSFTSVLVFVDSWGIL